MRRALLFRNRAAGDRTRLGLARAGCLLAHELHDVQRLAVRGRPALRTVASWSGGGAQAAQQTQDKSEDKGGAAGWGAKHHDVFTHELTNTRD
jgi:hypothetical protein